MSQIESIKVIKTLDNPLRFLYWEYSQVLFCLVFFLFGLVMTQSLLVGFLLAIASLAIYQKVKKKLIKNFKRFSYWMFFSNNVKAFPPSHKRKFIGL
jgi:type IV conjugative transfer system protein TraL